MNEKKVKLQNGFYAPNLCYGTGILQTYRYGRSDKLSAAAYWTKSLLKNRKQFYRDFSFPRVMRAVIENGCRMFDTSRVYGGAEYALGKALRHYKREEFTVVTKLCNADQYRGDVRGGLMRSLEELGLNYVDIYLMHWPVPGKFLDSWKEMETLYREGLCRAIGVCNCNIHHLEDLRRTAEIQPMINQFECHPLLTQNELRAYCRERGIQVMAYTSTARMDERLRKTALTPLAKKYGKTLAQIILKWHQQIGNIPIFNTYNANHAAENARLDDFELTADEVEQILAANINSRLRYDPDNCDFTQL